MVYLRMNGKRGHLTYGNRLAMESPEITSKICKLGGGTPALLRPVETLQDFTWLDLGKLVPALQNEKKF